MPTSIRLDAKTEGLLRRLAQHTGRTRSHIIREAIVRLADGESDRTAATRPYDMIADLIGVAQGGPPDLARRSGEAFRKLLTARGRRG